MELGDTCEVTVLVLREQRVKETRSRMRDRHKCMMGNNQVWRRGHPEGRANLGIMAGGPAEDEA